jgi:hypothetical protein
MQSQRDRVRHRKWQKARYRNDPAYREHVKEKKRTWTHAKIARCPEYRRLQLLRSRQGWLREKITDAIGRMRADESKLIKITAEIAKLAAACKGK